MPNQEDTERLDAALDQAIERIIALQREYSAENKGRDTERRRKLREIIESVSTVAGS